MFDKIRETLNNDEEAKTTFYFSNVTGDEVKFFKASCTLTENTAVFGEFEQIDTDEFLDNCKQFIKE